MTSDDRVAELIEEVAAYDENLLEKFMEDENSITEDEVHAALRAALRVAWRLLRIRHLLPRL